MTENTILTLKDYKQQIEELQKSIGDLENGTKKYGTLLNSTVGTLDSNIKQLSLQKQALNDLKEQYKLGTISLEQYMKGERELKVSMGELNKQINTQQKLANASKGSYEDLSQTLSLLKNAYKQLNETEKSSTSGKELAADINLLDQYLKETSANFGEFQRNVGNYETATVSLKGQLKELQTQMAQMLASGVKPTDDEFVKLAQDAGKIKDALNDAAAATKRYANDTRGMAAVLEVAQTGVAVFGAWKGAMSLFGAESEEATKVIQTMTSVTTLLNSVQQINKALFDNSTTTYRLFHKVLQAVGIEQKVNTVATEAHTGAMVADTVATTEATVATNLFKKALISTGIGAIVVLIGTLIAHLDDIAKVAKKAGQAITDFLGFTSEEERAAKKAAEAEKERAKELKDAADQMADGLSDEIGKLLVLDKTINDVTKSDKERIAAMQKVNELTGQQIFDLKNVRGELENNNGAIKTYIQNLYKQAQVQALTQKMAENYIEILKRGGVGTVEDEKLLDPYIDSLYLENQQLNEQIEKVLSTMEKYKKYKKESTKGKTGETDEQKKEAEAVEKLVKAQEALNKELELNLNIQRELNEIDNKLSPKEKAEEEVEAIDLEIKAQQDLQKIYKTASEDAKLSAKKREEYAEKVNEVELKIKSLNASKQIQIEKNLITEEERLKNQTLESIINDYNKQREIANNYWNEQKQFLTDQFLNNKITLEEYNKQLEDINNQSNIQKLQDDAKLAEDKLRFTTDNLQKLIDEGINPETEAYKQAYRDREDALLEHTKAMNNLTNAMVNNDVKAHKRATKETAEELKKRIKNTKDYLKATSTVFDTVADILQEDIDNKKDKGKEEEEQAKKEFEVLKAFQIGQALITGSMAALEAYESAWGDVSIPSTIAKQILAATQMAAAIGTTAWSVAQISKTQYGGGDQSTSSIPSPSSSSIAAIQMQPLLNEQADLNSLQTIQTQNSLQTVDNRVYIVESDIQESNNRVEVREKNVTF